MIVALRGGVIGVQARTPPRSVAVGDMGKFAGPVGDEGAVGLEMELHAIGGATDAETLVPRDGRGGKVGGIGGQGEGVGMPLEDREGFRDL